MKIIFFLIVYAASLLFEVSFTARLIAFYAPVSFFVFAVLLFFLKKEELAVFAISAIMLLSVFFSRGAAAPVSLALAAAISYLLKTIGGLYRRSAFLLHSAALLLVHEGARIAFSFVTAFPNNFKAELIAEGALLLGLALAVGLASLFAGRPRGYRI
ncbi:MAG: hypothetical protein HYW88_01185 [Candidatus Sungbacteria bacterium]|nr:hypothetical protein [Candidatus Sungbacteria bacterium]